MDAQLQEVIVNPVRSIALVAGDGQRPSDWFAIVVTQLGIGAFQKRLQSGGLVGLTGREMEVQRMTLAVAKQMNLRGKTAARTA